MRFLIYVACLCALITTPTFCASLSPEQARAKVEAAFDHAATLRETEAAKAPANNEAASADFYIWRMWSHVYSDSLLSIVKAISNGSDSQIWKNAVINELASANPNHRALACEILGMKQDADVVPKLGAMLDDSASAASMPEWTCGQMAGTECVVYHKMTVGQVARVALVEQTQIVFLTKSSFDRWWSANKDYSGKMWYWAARWKLGPYAYQDGMANLPADLEPSTSRDYSSDFTELSKLPSEKALEILLLHNIERVVIQELNLPLEDGNPAQRSVQWSSQEGPEPKDVAKFVSKHNLKPRLISLLKHERVWPLVDQTQSFSQLVEQIHKVGIYIFRPKDDQEIAKAQALAKSPEEIYELALLRADISPERAKQILTKTIQANPNVTKLATAYIQRFGTEPSDLLMPACMAERDKSDVASAIREAASKKLPVSREFILEIIQHLKVDDFNSRWALSYLAKATEILLNEKIVSELELSYLSFGKITAEEYAEREASMPMVFAIIKSKLTTALGKK